MHDIEFDLIGQFLFMAKNVCQSKRNDSYKMEIDILQVLDMSDVPAKLKKRLLDRFWDHLPTNYDRQQWKKLDDNKLLDR